ncbi:unnamed protein product [Brassica napus]|uniref:(rape) hypothetical protein n=1 Tax=Brassica napus TaxID=3708 RepID=A0A816X2U5_BRANA|nr:unnamed protein product [Brassica napus]
MNSFCPWQIPTDSYLIAYESNYVINRPLLLKLEDILGKLSAIRRCYTWGTSGIGYTTYRKMIEFLCATKVTRIQAEKEWCYIGCWKLSKKLQREISSFTCIVFDKTNDVGVLRYRVELSVSDKADDAVCLAWNAQIPTTVTYLFKSLLHLLINFCFSYSFYLS